MDKSKAMEIFVPSDLFKKMKIGNQCNNIENGFINKSFFFQNKEIVIIGGISSKIWGYHVVDIENYKEDIEPLFYIHHRDQVKKGKREIGYKYQKTRFGSRTVIFVGSQINIMAADNEVQLELF